MRVAILTTGTRGDMQPFVAIGCALRERGHDVVLCGPRDLTPFAAKAGLEIVPQPISAQELMSSDEGKAMLASGRLLRFLRVLERASFAVEREINAAFRAATAGADVIVSAAPLTLPLAALLAAHQRVPLVRVFLVPVVPTAAFASPVMTTRHLGGALNKLSHRALQRLMLLGSGPFAARFADELGVPRPKRDLNVEVERARGPALHAYSQQLVAKPADWGEHHVFAGIAPLSKETRARVGEGATPPGLEEFLADGDAPVFFGFGSMPVLDPAATLRMVEEVADDCGVRALIGAGWSDLQGSSARSFVVGAFDHDAVLPRCRAAVHHGGCGTTHAALRAGLPAVVCSFLVDQPFWASRLMRLGVGAHVRYADLTRSKLTAALRTILTDDASGRARVLGAKLRAEDGAAVCAQHIERWSTA